jgi:hypothetical protein
MENELDYTGLLIDTISELLPSLRIRYRTHAALMKHVGQMKFDETVEIFLDYVARSIPNFESFRKIEVTSLFRALLSCLIKYMEKDLVIPVTINTLCNNMHLLAFCIERDYPGYAESGLLRCIVQPGYLKLVVKDQQVA